MAGPAHEPLSHRRPGHEFIEDLSAEVLKEPERGADAWAAPQMSPEPGTVSGFCVKIHTALDDYTKIVVTFQTNGEMVDSKRSSKAGGGRRKHVGTRGDHWYFKHPTSPARSRSNTGQGPVGQELTALKRHRVKLR
jgi:hypothetical protein